MEKTVQDIIIRPIITEASMDALADRKYTFKVAKTANKIEIKKAVEQLFKDVKVEKVNTMNVRERREWEETKAIPPRGKRLSLQ